MSNLTKTIPDAVSFAGATILRLPETIRAEMRRQRAIKALDRIGPKLIEDVVISKAHALKALNRRAK
ncbi:MAG: hypothetical protein AAFR70_06115 [Pseudomonadota bacterium]